MPDSFEHNKETPGDFNYSHVQQAACIAIYDDLRSAPRVLKIPPAPTNEFIEALASTIYSHSQQAGGAIPYTVIREVSENFIHAQFREIVVSILDSGNTIRFADQGPGIADKKKAQIPGFTSATAPMKEYIRGVGSGLPIVKEYLSLSNGSITIDDNLEAGAVVTISLTNKSKDTQGAGKGAERQKLSQSLLPTLSPREKTILPLFLSEGALGITDVVKLTGMPQATVYNTLSRLEESGLIERTAGKKRILTELGYNTAQVQ